MAKDIDKFDKKILTVDDVDIISSLEGKKVLIGGCFDILHYGHLTFLKNAKNEGDVLIILLESDEFIEKNKHRKPVHTHTQRASILSYLTVVDYIVMLPLMKDNDEYQKLIEKISPHIIAVTAGDAKVELKKEHAKKIGAAVIVVTEQLPFSSTKYAPILGS